MAAMASLLTRDVYKRQVQGAIKDYLKIQYSGSDVLYVPVTQLDLLSRYTCLLYTSNVLDELQLLDLADQRDHDVRGDHAAGLDRKSVV